MIFPTAGRSPILRARSVMHGLRRALLRQALNHPLMTLEKLSTSYSFNRHDLMALVNPTTYRAFHFASLYRLR